MEGQSDQLQLASQHFSILTCLMLIRPHQAMNATVPGSRAPTNFVPYETDAQSSFDRDHPLPKEPIPYPPGYNQSFLITVSPLAPPSLFVLVG